MAQKIVTLVAGQLEEIEATVTSAGAGDAGEVVALGSDGKLDLTVMPTGIGPDTKSLVTSENLAAGDLVNVWNDGGTPKARKADASNGRKAHGFVLTPVTSPAAALVYFEGVITGLTGLTAGVPMYLSGSTAGAATATAVSSPGYLSQEIGATVSATEISFEPQRTVTLAS